jgi:hypothetical protein
MDVSLREELGSNVNVCQKDMHRMGFVFFKGELSFGCYGGGDSTLGEELRRKGGVVRAGIYASQGYFKGRGV